jgi:hypothetical protein
MAGYSGTPLAQKLGIKQGHRVALVDAPEGFTGTLGDLPEGVTLHHGVAGKEPYDVIVFFTDSRVRLRQRFAGLAARLKPAGGFWVAWPKKASGVATDLTEDLVRAVGLEAGLVDNKVCAVDETWSGLRFVVRIQDRPKKGAGHA